MVPYRRGLNPRPFPNPSRPRVPFQGEGGLFNVMKKTGESAGASELWVARFGGLVLFPDVNKILPEKVGEQNLNPKP